MATKINKLSARQIDALEPDFHSDGGGLYPRVRNSGSRSWVFRYTRNGKVREIGLGGSINVRAGEGQATLSYRLRSQEGDWIGKLYPIRIERTSCHFGGTRPWFRCPGAGCGRRVALLFGGAVFACRPCYQLAYSSQRETAGDRATRRVNRIRERLQWEPGFLNGPG